MVLLGEVLRTLGGVLHGLPGSPRGLALGLEGVRRLLGRTLDGGGLLLYGLLGCLDLMQRLRDLARACQYLRGIEGNPYTHHVSDNPPRTFLLMSWHLPTDMSYNRCYIGI